MKLLTKFSALALGTFATTSLSFDIHTHTAMTREAVEQSRIGLPIDMNALLMRLGLRGASGVLAEGYVGFGPYITEG